MPAQVLVFCTMNELMIEYSSKVKARKGLFVKKRESERLPLNQEVLQVASEN
jgi:hypothetical protein